MHSVLRVTSRRLPGAQVQNRVIPFILSTEVEDRAGDSIDQTGWHLENYLKTPVVLWGHDHDCPAIGRMVRIGTEGGNLVGAVQFATAEQFPFADTIFRLVEGEFIGAGSVGFIPRKYELIETEKGDISGLRFLEQELIEYSIVNVPMNPQALARAASAGIDATPLAKAMKSNAVSYEDARKALLERAKVATETPNPTIVKSNLGRFKRRAEISQSVLRLCR